jgi:hypothetical protein
MRSSAPVADTRNLVAAGLGQRREVLGAQGADVEACGRGDQLDVLLGRAQLERDVAGGQCPHDLEQQARRQNDGARAVDVGPQRHAEGDLHVGGPQLDSVVGHHLDAG